MPGAPVRPRPGRDATPGPESRLLDGRCRRTTHPVAAWHLQPTKEVEACPPTRGRSKGPIPPGVARRGSSKPVSPLTLTVIGGTFRRMESAIYYGGSET